MRKYFLSIDHLLIKKQHKIKIENIIFFSMAKTARYTSEMIFSLCKQEKIFEKYLLPKRVHIWGGTFFEKHVILKYDW